MFSVNVIGAILVLLCQFCSGYSFPIMQTSSCSPICSCLISIGLWLAFTSLTSFISADGPLGCSRVLGNAAPRASTINYGWWSSCDEKVYDKTWNNTRWKTFLTSIWKACLLLRVRVFDTVTSSQELWTQRVRMIPISVVSLSIEQRISFPIAGVSPQRIFHLQQLSFVNFFHVLSRWLNQVSSFGSWFYFIRKVCTERFINVVPQVCPRLDCFWR